MLRHSIVLFVLLIFCLPVLPQEAKSIIPYVYVLQTEWYFDSFVMDVISGETLYEVASSCPQLMSPNRQWFVYSQLPDYELFAVDLQTGESLAIADDGSVVAWSEDNTRFMYSIYEEDDFSYYIYDLTTKSSSFIYRGFIPARRFLGTSLFFVAIEDDLIQLYRWDEETELIDSFERPETDEEMSLQDVSLSPNRQFITLGYVDYNSVPVQRSSYLINLATGEVEVFSEYDGLLAFWRPQSPASFAYSSGGLSYLYDATRGEEENLGFYGNASYYGLSWSPDGAVLATIYYEEDTVALYLLEIETGEVIDLGQYPMFGGLFIEWVSPSQLVYQAPFGEDGQHDIFLYDLRTGEQKQISDTPEIDEMSGCPIG